MDYDLLAIGNGRESISEALSAARRGEFVALVRTENGTNKPGTLSKDQTQGTNPSWIVPNWVDSADLLKLALSRFSSVGGVRMSELRMEAVRVANDQWQADRLELEQLGVDIFHGRVCFVDERSVKVTSLLSDPASREMTLKAQRIVLGCGTRSAKPSHVRFDSHRILNVESLLQLDELPRSMIVIGAGETGLEYAMLLGALGVDVTVVDEKASIFDTCHGLMNSPKLSEMQSLDIAFRLGDEMIGVATRGCDSVAVTLASGKVFVAEAALVCVGRVGETASLNLEAAGVGLDERGRVWCDADGGTWASHIKAVGEIVGFRPTKSLAG